MDRNNSEMFVVIVACSTTWRQESPSFLWAKCVCAGQFQKIFQDRQKLNHLYLSCRRMYQFII
jgi:hypothetical protein